MKDFKITAAVLITLFIAVVAGSFISTMEPEPQVEYGEVWENKLTRQRIEVDMVYNCERVNNIIQRQKEERGYPRIIYNYGTHNKEKNCVGFSVQADPDYSWRSARYRVELVEDFVQDYMEVGP